MLHPCAVDASDAKHHKDGGPRLHDGTALQVVTVLFLARVVACLYRHNLAAVGVLLSGLVRLEIINCPWQTDGKGETGAEHRDKTEREDETTADAD